MATVQSQHTQSNPMQQHTARRFKAGRYRQRRGVMLLVSLVLLVMFLMLGVTFVLTAGNFRRSSEAYQRMLERPSADLPERSGDLLDSVARDLVRGTTNPDSPFSEENLLEDLYGQPALRGAVTSAGGGQLVSLGITPDADFTPSTIDDYYSGLVLTMLTGNLKGQSTRIVGWNDSTKTLSVVAFLQGGLPYAHASVGDLFLVNGRPFSGTGAATSSAGRRLNEDYDVADANNPWLASKETAGTVSPSYKSLNVSTSSTEPAVDNDGDGQPDSVWIDTGLPLQLQPDGSYVKPLVAMLVRDLGGRVNLNAHGSPAQVDDADGASAPLGQGYGPAEIDPWHALNIHKDVGFDITQFLRLRLSETGSGLPADGSGGSYVQPDNDVPGSDADNTSQQYTFSNYYQFGSEDAVVTPHDPHGNSFYRADPTTGAVTFATAAGKLANNFVGSPYALGLDTAEGIPTENTPYAPEDLERVLRFSDADADAIDSRLYEDLTVCLAETGEIDPDDLARLRDRITTESWDLPVAGLSWPQELSGELTDAPRHITDLFAAKIKKVNAGLTDDQARQRAAALIVQLDPNTPFDTSQDPPTPRYVDAAGTLIDQTEPNWEHKIVRRGLIGPGLLRGTRMNVNRLFGNGVDDIQDRDGDGDPDDDGDGVDDGNGVVDDPGEADPGSTGWLEPEKVYNIDPDDPAYNAQMDTLLGSVDFDPNGDGHTYPWDVDQDGDMYPAVDDPDDRPYRRADLAARQHYAQQLYLLLMLLSDSLENRVPLTSATLPDKRRMLARRLAQFAVNAADYRDPDAIMTGFEYDADPFDATGWDVDGDLSTDESNDNVDNNGNGKVDAADVGLGGNPLEVAGTDPDRGVVWGCEDPALFLTETYAMHDRRVRDVNELLPTPVLTDRQNTTQEIDQQTSEVGLKQTLAAKYASESELPESGQPLPVADVKDFLESNGGVIYEDNDFDQYAKPEGSLFVELYRPPSNPQADLSTYPKRQDLYESNGALDLSKQNAAGSPVWRLAISAPHPAGPDLPSTTGVNERYQAGPTFPVFNQLADRNGDSVVDPSNESANGQWNSAVTMQPGLPIPNPEFDSSDPQKAPIQTATDQFVAAPALKTKFGGFPASGAIEIERLVYFSPQSYIATHLVLVETAMRERLDPGGGQLDPSWDGIYCPTSASAQLAEGDYFVVAPREQTPFGRAADADGNGHKEDTASSEQIVLSNLMDADGNPCQSIICGAASDQSIPLSVSEPLPASYYPKNDAGGTLDGKYIQPLDTPLDKSKDWLPRIQAQQSLRDAAKTATTIPDLSVTDVFDQSAEDPASQPQTFTYPFDSASVDYKPYAAYYQPGTIEQFCTVFLQRLANPLEAWNPVTNPYRTVDAMPIDLTVFNGDDDTPDPVDLNMKQALSGEELATAMLTEFVAPTKYDARQRGSASQLLAPVADLLTPGGGFAGGTTLGAPNYGGGAPSPAPFWPNRPFVSQYELLMVPASAPSTLAMELGSHTGTPATTFADGFPHTLNFFFANSSGDPQLGRLFEYLHVPSKYSGAQVALDPGSLSGVPGFAPPFNVLSSYREPGRVNLNTIEGEQDEGGNDYSRVWEAVMHGASTETASTKHRGSDYSGGGLSEPFHGPGEVTVPSEGGGSSDTAMPLLDAGLGFEDTSQSESPFLRYQPINRMGNLTTTRSNVYAVWMTLGFFETNSQGNFSRDADGNLRETGGSDIERHRAFYMIDRSIPVGYENGHDHNTDDVFRVKRYIE